MQRGRGRGGYGGGGGGYGGGGGRGRGRGGGGRGGGGRFGNQSQPPVPRGVGRGKDMLKPAWMTNGTTVATPEPAKPFDAQAEAHAIQEKERQAREHHQDRQRFEQQQIRDAERAARKGQRGGGRGGRGRGGGGGGGGRDGPGMHSGIGGGGGSGKRMKADTAPLPEQDSIHRGKVITTTSYGAFIRLPSGFEGLCHISKLASRRVDRVEDVVSVDDEVYVKVLEVDQGRKRVVLSLRDVDQETASAKGYGQQTFQGSDKNAGRGGAAPTSNAINKSKSSGVNIGGGGGSGMSFVTGNDFVPEMFSIWKGQVTSVRDYGCFIKIQDKSGNQAQGMVHVSQLTDAQRVFEVKDFVQEGEAVYVKVIEHREPQDGSDRLRIAFSMKHVKQSNGQDLDPHNAKLEMEIGRRQGTPGTSTKGPNQPHDDTVHRDATNPGQAARDGKMMDKFAGKAYELVNDDDDDIVRGAAAAAALALNEKEEKRARKKAKKEKKARKKEKKGKRKRKASVSDDSSSEDERSSSRKKRSRRD